MITSRTRERAPTEGVQNVAIDSYRFLDFATRQIMKAWVKREGQATRPIPWCPLTKPLARCTVALVTSAGVARKDDVPFDQESERRNPWWGDPTHRVIPMGTTAADVELHHMHIDTRFGKEDLNVVLPMDRLEDLAREGVVGAAARSHYSVMGYILRPERLERETAPAIARIMNLEGVDAAALVPA
ncbi:MAG: glycine/sarcosine/betaine reductase selenoprotein B family protein [Acidobacteriota bacterium]